MRKTVLFVVFALSAICAFPQDTILLMEATVSIKASTTESFYFGFTKGDRIIFSVNEVNRKEISNITVSKCPESVVYSSEKESSISKSILVMEENVYEFKISNTSLLKKNKIKVIIQRVPSSNETRNFNTAWEWKTVYDTVYQYYKEDSLVGHDTIFYTETIKEIKNKRTEETVLVDRTENVKSKGIVVHDNPRVAIEVVLPIPQKEDLHEESIVAWGYWIAVGKNANTLWNNAIKVTSTVGYAFTGGIAGLLLGGASNIEIPATSEKVQYSITDKENSTLFMNGSDYHYIKNGYGSGGYGLIDGKNLKKSVFYINLYNDNIHNRIDVTVKASVIMSIIDYEYKTYTRYKIKPQYIQVTKRKMDVSGRKIRANVK